MKEHARLPLIEIIHLRSGNQANETSTSCHNFQLYEDIRANEHERPNQTDLWYCKL